MTERAMARRHRYQQRHKRSPLPAWLLGGACGLLLVVLGAMGCIDWRNQLPPPERGNLPSLALGESSTSASGEADAQSRQPPQPVYQDSTDWSLRLVNRWNPVPVGYTVNLKELPGGEQVDERVYEPLMEMLEAAREGNWEQLPRVISGYRTQEEQQRLYDDEVNKYKSQGYSQADAMAEAGQWVALPGTSEHQLGLAVDVEGDTYDVFLWLQENSWKYGFIFRYPGSKTDITGTVEEVWHYRYVGKEAAAEMYEQGLCLEEYLGSGEVLP